jgi:hypothetical protein
VADRGGAQIRLLDVGAATATASRTSPCQGGAWGSALSCRPHEGLPIDPKSGRCIEGKGRPGPYPFDPLALRRAAADEERS